MSRPERFYYLGSACMTDICLCLFPPLIYFEVSEQLASQVSYLGYQHCVEQRRRVKSGLTTQQEAAFERLLLD